MEHKLIAKKELKIIEKKKNQRWLNHEQPSRSWFKEFFFGPSIYRLMTRKNKWENTVDDWSNAIFRNIFYGIIGVTAVISANKYYNNISRIPKNLPNASISADQSTKKNAEKENKLELNNSKLLLDFYDFERKERKKSNAD